MMVALFQLKEKPELSKLNSLCQLLLKKKCLIPLLFILGGIFMASLLLDNRH